MTRAIAVVLAAALLGGCAMSREAQLERKADQVESSLKTEQGKVLASSMVDKPARLDYLTSLRNQLSLANVARGAVPYTVPEDKRPLAWDILDEVYGTLEWNIPLAPSQSRPMPAAFANGVLNLNTGIPAAPGTPPGIAK
ncbi:MAG: hypothetical protein ACREJO_01300 [Phycisphaerales bacterium]